MSIFNTRTKTYTIGRSDHDYEVSESNILLLIYLYINKGLSKSQVECTDILNKVGCLLNLKEVKYVLKTLEITKDYPFILTPIDIKLFGSDKRIEESNITYVKQRFKELQERLVIDGILSNLEQSLNKVTVPDITFSDSVEKKAGVVILFSDWHVGKRVSGPVENRYDSKVFACRLEEILFQIEEYASRFDSRQSEVAIGFMGDILEGPLSNMRLSQAQGMDLYDYEQIDFAARAIAKAVARVVNTFESKIKIAAVAGNHDRVATKKSDDLMRTGHKLVMEMARKYLSYLEEKNIIEWLNIEKRVFAFSMGKSRVILNHGDSVSKPERFMLLDGEFGSVNKLYIQGHLHSRSFVEKDGYTHIICPALVGPTNYEEYDLGHRSRPGQTIVEIDYNNLSTNVRWLDC